MVLELYEHLINGTMEQKKPTKKRITELYHFMSDAKMQKLKDDEKIALIKLLRTMKPIAVEVMDALHEATDKAAESCPDDAGKAAEITNGAMEDVWHAEADIDIRVLSHDPIERLALSNDWTFSLIDELEDEFCKP